MTVVKLLLGVWALQSAFVTAWGDGCNGTETFGDKVVNMCGHSDVTMGRVLISVTTDTMGTSTRCSCTLRPKTSGLQTTSVLYLRRNDSLVNKCHLSMIQIDPLEVNPSSSVQNFTCTTPLDSVLFTSYTTSDVTVTLTRPDTSVGVSYCLYFQPYRYIENDMVLSCQSGTTSSASSITLSTTLSTITTSSSTRSSTTSPSPTPTTSFTTSSSQSPTQSFDSDTLTTAPKTDGDSTGTAPPTARESARDQDSVPIGAVAGIVVGVTALICITVVVSLYIRYRTKLLASRQTGADNSAYTSLSDITRVTPRADPNYAVIQSGHSSSQPGGSDATAPTGVYETVDGGSSATPDVTHVSRSNDGAGTYYNAEAVQQL